jgi:nitrogen fixation/metabolism regulation signal transduction histidine kinase
MNNHNFKLTVRIFFTVFFFALTGYFFASQSKLLTGVSLIAALFSLYHFVTFHNRTIKDMYRFINAIRYNEFNISFHNHSVKGLDKNIEKAMEAAIHAFDAYSQKKEALYNFYDLLLNRIDFAILVVDTGGQITWINKAALGILGRIKTLQDLQRSFPNIYELSKQTYVEGIKTVALSDDFIVSVSVVYANIQKEKLRIISLKNIRSVIDETENEAWKKLVGIMRHEIINSMAPIISLSETFAEQHIDYDRELLHKTMKTIHRRSKGLVEFVQNYKSLTNIPTPQLKSFEVNEMLNDVTNLLKARHIEFEYQVHPSNLNLLADRNQIEQVLINLIKNAAEAVKENEKAIIRVEASFDNQQHPQLTVTDNGEGILPNVKKNIFIPFFTTRENGSGIGLSLCKQIINAHRGTISVDSTPGQGSCFTIKL